MSLISIAPSDHTFKAIRKAQEKFVARDARTASLEAHICEVVENNACLKRQAEISNEMADCLDRITSFLDSYAATS